MNATPIPLVPQVESGDAPDAGDAPDLPDVEYADDGNPAGAFDPDGSTMAQAVLAPVLLVAPDNTTEQQLNEWIAAVVVHDERALSALYDATVSRVYGMILRIVRRPSMAEEVVEDTYFQVWRQAVRFDPARGRAMTWLLSMARSRAIDALRREHRFQNESTELDLMPEPVDPRPAADELLDAARGHADLHRALMMLNAQPRQLVAMAFFNGLSHEEIASQTALPLGTVKSQIRRALLTLRQALRVGGLDALPS